MENWTTVFLYEITRQFKRKAFLLTTFGIPLLGALAVGGFLLYQEFSSDDNPDEDVLQAELQDQNPVGYVDLTGFFVAPESDSPFAPYISAYTDFDSGEAALEAGEIDGLYVIEADYFETGSVTLWLSRINLNTLSGSTMEAFLVNQMAQEADPNIIFRLRFPVTSVTEQRIQTDGTAAEGGGFGANFLLVYVFAMTLMISTFTASGYLMQSVIEEKESQIIEIILTSVRPFPLLLGKTLAMGLLGLFQISVWMASAFALMSIAAAQIIDLSRLEAKPETVVIALIYFILDFGFVGAIFAALGSIANTTREGSQLAGWVVMPTIIPLFFTAIFAEDPGSALATALSLVPVTAPLAMVMRSAVSDVPLWELAVSIILMSGVMILALWLAGRMFRVHSLLRGTAPKLREIPGLILRG